MPGRCPTIASDTAFLQSAVTVVDCHARTIGEYGYQALASPGSAVGLALAGVLTLFVALFGYRAMLGRLPDAGQAVTALVKLGFVLTLATSWPVFRTLVYNLAIDAPAGLAADIGGSASLPGAIGGQTARLQAVDNGLVLLQQLGTGAEIGPGVGAPRPNQQLTPAQQQEQYRQSDDANATRAGDPARDGAMLSQARTLYLAQVIGSVAIVRLIAGILLALGPLFALFLLFEHSRGLFAGWVRGLFGTALGALTTAIILSVELAMLEPWLVRVLAYRRAGYATPEAAPELLVMTLAFAVVLLAALAAAAGVAHGLHLPAAWVERGERWLGTIGEQMLAPERAPATQRAYAEERSRALAIADAVAATQRREQAMAGARSIDLADGTVSPRRTQAGHAASAGATAPVALGHSYRRRTTGRVSARAAQRDGRA